MSRLLPAGYEPEDVPYLDALGERLRVLLPASAVRMRTDVMTCPICKGPMADDMAVFVDLDNVPTLVCFICDERAVEAANVGDPDDD